ncbi:unnamed protein product [Brugia timori]|uniref:Ovule protein n=1 Tax=Brugia timori TaxID=42155 RepID=A0A0R3RCT5_9BILA|nr:unnamed protein product [Brugia timori]
MKSEHSFPQELSHPDDTMLVLVTDNHSLQLQIQHLYLVVSIYHAYILRNVVVQLVHQMVLPLTNSIELLLFHVHYSQHIDKYLVVFLQYFQFSFHRYHLPDILPKQNQLLYVI